jgi:hypothetical protein
MTTNTYSIDRLEVASTAETQANNGKRDLDKQSELMVFIDTKKHTNKLAN